MSLLSFRSIAAIIVSALPLAAMAQDSGRQVLFTFDSHYDFKSPRTDNACTWTPLADGKPGVKITTPADKSWPGVRFPATSGKWDLSAYEYISLDLHNVDKKDIDVFVRVDNPGSDGLKNCITERAFVAPDQRTTLTIPIKRASNSPVKLFGMQGYPQGLYPDGQGLDPSNIVEIVVFTGKGTPTSNTFEVSNVYAAGKFQPPTWLEMSTDQFFPFIDKFGQFKYRDWPGKIHSDEELTAAKETEAKQLAADQGPADWDKYGGWAKGPTLEATGHFHTAKQNGKWWLVDPDGHLFFSTGVTGVRPGWAETVIDERANWFTDLPDQAGPAKEHYKQQQAFGGHYAGKSVTIFDFSTMNLQRKYGDNWKNDYGVVVSQRLRDWGLNTMANWSYGGWESQDRTPYVGVMFYNAKKLRKTGSGFPDVFDPSFEKNVNAAAKQWLSASANDPWCIGYFCDNEMPWGGETQLAIDTLVAPADQAAKKELIRWLKEKYPSVAELNKAWGTNYASFDGLPIGIKSVKAPPSTPAAIADLTAFNDRIAETYFRTMHDAMKAIAPKKLYLGCRSVGGSQNVIAMAVKYCDIVSYNRYCFSVRDQKLPGGLDGPMIIGEFHFGASDRGPFSNGLVSAESQTDRGEKYAAYVNSALDNPQIVGVHWFQYGDEATTGRGMDDENAQCGFVDVCDTPYAETIAASRATAEKMYGRRSSGTTEAK